MVAAGEHDLGTGVDEPGEGVGEHAHRLGRGQGPVVDVTRDEHGADLFGAHEVDEEVDEPHLGVEQPHLVERAPQVPVGGVDDPHVARL